MRLVYTVEVEEAIRDKRDHFADDMRQELATTLRLSLGRGPRHPRRARQARREGPRLAARDGRSFASGSRTPPTSPSSTTASSKSSSSELSEVDGPGRQRDHLQDPRGRRVANSRARRRPGEGHRLRRVDELGLREASVTTRDEDIIVEVPGSDETSFSGHQRDYPQDGPPRVQDGGRRGQREFFGRPPSSTRTSRGEGIAQYTESAPDGLDGRPQEAAVQGASTRACRASRQSTRPRRMNECLARFKTWATTLNVPDDHAIGFERSPSRSTLRAAAS